MRGGHGGFFFRYLGKIDVYHGCLTNTAVRSKNGIKTIKRFITGIKSRSGERLEAAVLPSAYETLPLLSPMLFDRRFIIFMENSSMSSTSLCALD